MARLAQHAVLGGERLLVPSLPPAPSSPDEDPTLLLAVDALRWRRSSLALVPPVLAATGVLHRLGWDPAALDEAVLVPVVPSPAVLEPAAHNS